MIVETEGLTKMFGRVVAIDDLSIKIPKGAVALLGPNGAGKSTLLKLLLGLLTPTAGSANVLGYDIALQGLPLRRKIGFMPEHDVFIPHMEGVDFVRYLAELSGLSRSDAIQRAHEVCN